eukprot:6456630-Amphidinium_carterae.2
MLHLSIALAPTSRAETVSLQRLSGPCARTSQNDNVVSCGRLRGLRVGLLHELLVPVHQLARCGPHRNLGETAEYEGWEVPIQDVMAFIACTDHPL